MRDKGWRNPRGAGEFLAPGSTRQKYPGWLHAPRQRCPQGTEGTKMDRAGLAHGAEPGQTLPAAPHTPSSCQRSAQPTQLFFFFFLASASLLLPMLEWLVMLLRLEMLSEEFCRLMRSSGAGERSQGVGRDRERSGQTMPVPVPQPPGSSPQPTPRSLPSPLGPAEPRSGQSLLVRRIPGEPSQKSAARNTDVAKSPSPRHQHRDLPC